MLPNLKLEFKEVVVDYLNAKPYRTRVVLGNSDGAVYPVFFDLEYATKPEVELYALAMDVIYERNFPDRAEKEKFEKIESAIARSERATEDGEARIKQAIKESAAQQLTVSMLLEKAYEKGWFSDEDFMRAMGNDDHSLEEQ